MAIKLITSAAYVGSELEAEYGKLPPAFLPVGHRRLYEAQLQTLEQIVGPVHLSLPESYVVPSADLEALARLKVNVVHVPDGLSLAASILYTLEMIGDFSGPVHILHGDTLIYELPIGHTDIVAVGPPPDTYSWGAIDDQLEAMDAFQVAGQSVAERSVLAGYFSFADCTELRRCLARAQGDFVGAVRRYRDSAGIKPLPVTSWLDFGHLQTYYRSRCSVRTQRAFNELDVSFRVVQKTGDNAQKIAAEAHWFDRVPHPLRIYTPAYLGHGVIGGREGYALEYLPIPTLHELYVFGALAEPVWMHILEACARFLADCRAAGANEAATTARGALEKLTIGKTFDRLKAFEKTAGVPAKEEWRFEGKPLPSLRRIADITASQMDLKTDKFLGVMHGDFCFTNIFFDFRTRQVRVIDPRGTIDNASADVFGDLRYDLAKLNHSLAGGYDFILAGRYHCSGFAERDMSLAFPQDSAATWLPAKASQAPILGLTLDDPQVTAITVHLFLSMLPLHADRPDRQRAFVASALRLFSRMEKQS